MQSFVHIPPWFLLSAFGIIVAVGVIVVLTEVFLGSPSSNEQNETKKYSYRRKQFFMTKREHEFYKTLVQLVGNDYFIFAQVHLPTIIDEKMYGQDWRASRSHINRKSVDFVLCDKEYITPKLAIELDDWSHSRPDRQKRDVDVERMLSEAGMPLLRVTDTVDLAEKIKARLS